MSKTQANKSTRPIVPLAIVMLTLNEAHNMEAVLQNISGWAQEIFIVDSYSTDATIDIALKYGVHVVQRAFSGFGNQWNFALEGLPINAPWTMKLDPDERLTPELKVAIDTAIVGDAADALIVNRRLWFMGRPLPVRQKLVRIWRTGACKFSDVLVNEHPLVEGRFALVPGDLEHRDSPNLQNWWDKQNRYTTVEAVEFFRKSKLAAEPNLFGSALQRRMWMKANFRKIPFRYALLFFYQLFALGAWRAGRLGITWAHLRAEVHRMIELKLIEMQSLGQEYELPRTKLGKPDPRVQQYK